MYCKMHKHHPNKKLRLNVKPFMRIFKNVLLMLFLGVLLSSTQAVAQNNIDTEESFVSFEIGNMKRTVIGSIKGMNGEVNFDPSNLEGSSFKVCIDPATVDTENKKRDKHLRSDPYFNIEEFPSICFESLLIVPMDNGFLVKGNLTILEETKEVEIPFLVVEESFMGKMDLNRKEYGIAPKVGNFMVREELSLNIVCKLLQD